MRLGSGDPVPGIVIGVPLHEQGEPGAGADLQERQWFRKQCQGGQQRRAPGGLVGLRAPAEHGPGELVAPVGDQAPERGEIGRLAEQVAGRREQQVRLPLGRGQRVEERQDQPVAGYRCRQLHVPRRPAARFSGENPVVHSGTGRQVMPGHRHDFEASLPALTSRD